MDVSKGFHRRPLIEADPDGLQKRETSMFFSRFCVAVDNLRGLKRKEKSEQQSDQAEKKNPPTAASHLQIPTAESFITTEKKHTCDAGAGSTLRDPR